MTDRKGDTGIPAVLNERLSKIHVLTHAELAQLFGVIADLRDRAIFLLAYRHGIRASEIGLLERDDVDYKANRITIHRLMRSPSNIHPLQKDEREALKRYLKSRDDNSGALFLGPRGDAVTRRGLDWLMKGYGAQAKLPREKRHFHALKHSIAVHLLSAGADLRSVHKWLGHMLLQSTALYLYLAEER
ncbi:MAG: tyrosine-type recombinase/integrase [Acidobacteriota bacterium]|nr:tyrosine-type recombinase/integrase [Acidobacteriota bacterium]